MRTLAVIAVVAAGLGGLLWLTLASQGATCEVCVAFEGRRACRTASAATPDEATRQAQSTACGLVTGGVTGDLACLRTPPESAVCE